MKAILTLCLCSVFSFGQITTNQLIYYPLDGNTNDSSGNNYNGTAFNITYGTDRLGNPNGAAYFNGTNSYINFPNLTTLKPDLPISFSFWVKYDNSFYQNQVIFNTSFEGNRSSGIWFNSSSGSGGYAVNYGDGSYFYTADSRNTYLSNTVIVPAVWHQVVVVVNSGSNMKIYVDCVENGGTYSGFGQGLTYSLTPGCLGRHDRNLSLPEDYFKGYLDDFRYWNRALTTEEITALCNNALAVTTVEETEVALEVYPNPAHDVLNIATSGSDIQHISIINAMGMEVYQGGYTPVIDISTLQKGIYLVKLDSESKSIVKKIVKH